MPCVTVILTVMTVLGAGLTVFGLVRALVEAKKQVIAAQKRLDDAMALSEEEGRCSDAIDAKYERLRSEVRTPEETQALSEAQSDENDRKNREFEARYAAIDVDRPSLGSLPWLAMFESKRLVSLVLNSSRRDFSVAILGVAVSTAAGVWSLWVN